MMFILRETKWIYINKVCFVHVSSYINIYNRLNLLTCLIKVLNTVYLLINIQFCITNLPILTFLICIVYIFYIIPTR